MLEAVTTDLVFTISLKRSTLNIQLSTSWAGRLHHLRPDTECLCATAASVAMVQARLPLAVQLMWRSLRKQTDETIDF
jgi:hypothetical protein